jgi:phage shock protein E
MINMHRIIFSRIRYGVLLLFGLFYLSACTPPLPASLPTITVSELLTRLEDGSIPVILDVRSAEEYAAGHIPGAMNVPHNLLAEQLSSLNLSTSDEVVVYCEVGGRAGLAETVLREASHSNVRDLEGHMKAWRAAGHPME